MWLMPYLEVNKQAVAKILQNPVDHVVLNHIVLMRFIMFINVIHCM